jgi:hypothetical protein
MFIHCFEHHEPSVDVDFSEVVFQTNREDERHLDDQTARDE